MSRSSASDVWVVGTADTKGAEMAYVRDRLARAGWDAQLVDLSTRSHDGPADIAAGDVAAHHPDGAAAVFGAPDRGAAVGAMQQAFEAYVQKNGPRVGGAIGLGGGGGTAMVSAGFRQLAYGVPKLIVSTLASGNVAPYVGMSDIAMLPSVTDISGLNRLTRTILANGAGALAGMLAAPEPRADDTDRPTVGLSMFGVTTEAVTSIAAGLGEAAEPMIFHATGTGGQIMERLVRDGQIDALIDITTTEIADLLVGGVLPALPDRLDVVAQTGIPYIGSLGACDMVNFAAQETVPERFSARRFHVHNSNVTLMRTTPAECDRIGSWIAQKLNACDGPVRFLIPQNGVSALDVEGGPFSDPAADEALFTAVLRSVEQTDNRRVAVLPCHINDPDFAAAALAAYHEITGSQT
ncbi:Tm-1-like ATP-binding domain-containing protein [Oceanomicrobium pacificus]|uniref:UPF0261 family protein n=1 Tax=Oceanomicrobium pacificus TaxID=2692916 RepID=A0A6B0TIX4_9RHOB|nr:Tm-1-like ATP-binding domain-containing protein [Oceanomicrobium pacificus]MXU64327.1 UPF0261 family protein [Oceanomicrobium pacificus]